MTWGAIKARLHGIVGSDAVAGVVLSRSVGGPFETTAARARQIDGRAIVGGYCIQHDLTFQGARCPSCHDRSAEAGHILDRLLLEEARAQRWYETGLTSAAMIRARWPDALPDFPSPALTLRPEHWPDEPTAATLRELRFEAAIAAATQMRLETYFRRNAHWLLESLPVHYFRGQIQVIWSAQGAR